MEIEGDLLVSTASLAKTLGGDRVNVEVAHLVDLTPSTAVVWVVLMMELRQMLLDFLPGRTPRTGTARREDTGCQAHGDNSLDGLLREAVGHARRLGLPALARSLSIVWNQRLVTTAGRASPLTRRIELNPRLNGSGPDELRRTMLHELAHLVAYERAGSCRIRAHGAEWRQACTDLGIIGESSTHALPWEGRRQRRKFRYTCPRCLRFIERVRPFRATVACPDCCRAHARGRYDDRFRLVKTKLPS